MQVSRGIRGRRDGVALLYAVFGAFVAIGMVTVMFTMAGVTRTRSEGKRSRVQAQYLAEGAIESLKLQMKDAKANWTLPELMQGWADQTQAAEDEGDPDLYPTVDVAGNEVRFEVKQIAASENVADAAGIETELTPYEVETVATIDGIQRRAGKVFYLEASPIFTYAVFYTDDLEILPGPNMTLGGRVHSNGSMYLGCGNTLTMDTNYVRAANTGISAFIDSSGRITMQSSLFAPEVLSHTVYPNRSPLTFYSRFGDLFSILCILFSCIRMVYSIITVSKSREK